MCEWHGLIADTMPGDPIKDANNKDKQYSFFHLRSQNYSNTTTTENLSVHTDMQNCFLSWMFALLCYLI